MAESTKPAPSQLLRWVTGVTAVLTLAFAVQKAVQLVGDGNERRRATSEYYRVGKQQQAAADYASAWKSFESGLKAAEPGGQLARMFGQLDSERRQLREAQEDLAMDWLRNVRASPARNETFSSIVDKLLPVINTGIVSGDSTRKAELQAHLGWAHFLLWREGRRELDPEQQYRKALESDPHNSFAHAFTGHWQLWTGNAAALSDARSHFSAALISGRARDQVRKLQLSAIINLGQAGDLELLRLGNEMRRNNETINAGVVDRLWHVYRFACPPRGREVFAPVSGTLPIADHTAMFQLFSDFDQTKSIERDACLAALTKAAGQRQ